MEPSCNNGAKKVLPPIRSEQATPKVGIDFRIEIVYKYID
ncbi:hypothetical protein JCM19274_5034 [Algibacter lectus]|uniref:Uncharacterized protein n=1 Tax=Algibacter lectus TaxID=221126 RepID=A0A090WJZ2_9FLAO|nr:hypothetical protein JCM19274_5034 [Algibacter lectus]